MSEYYDKISKGYNAQGGGHIPPPLEVIHPFDNDAGSAITQGGGTLTESEQSSLSYQGKLVISSPTNTTPLLMRFFSPLKVKPYE